MFPEDLYALLASSNIHFLVKHLLSFSLVDHLTIDEPKGASFATSHQRFMSTIHRGYKAATFTFLWNQVLENPFIFVISIVRESTQTQQFSVTPNQTQQREIKSINNEVNQMLYQKVQSWSTNNCCTNGNIVEVFLISIEGSLWSMTKMVWEHWRNYSNFRWEHGIGIAQDGTRRLGGMRFINRPIHNENMPCPYKTHCRTTFQNINELSLLNIYRKIDSPSLSLSMCKRINNWYHDLVL